MAKVMKETKTFGFELLKERSQELGSKVRALLDSLGFKSVAGPGWTAPQVMVS